VRNERERVRVRGILSVLHIFQILKPNFIFYPVKYDLSLFLINILP